MSEESKKRRNTAAGVMIPAGLLIGMGIGWVMGTIQAGLFIGLGVGFLLFGIIMIMVHD